MALSQRMKNLCGILAALGLLAALILELISSLAQNKQVIGAKDRQNIQMYHNWAMILVLMSISLALMCK